MPLIWLHGRTVKILDRKILSVRRQMEVFLTKLEDRKVGRDRKLADRLAWFFAAD